MRRIATIIWPLPLSAGDLLSSLIKHVCGSALWSVSVSADWSRQELHREVAGGLLPLPVLEDALKPYVLAASSLEVKTQFCTLAVS